MATTKIINVLKNDSFEELLDIFRETSAQEVIFVLPKKSKAFKTEGHFMILDKEAQIASKTVSFLCSNPEVNNLAKEYNFDVLMPRQTQSKKTTAINVVTQIAADREYFELLEKETGHSPLLAVQQDE